jgi:hypothetical protein
MINAEAVSIQIALKALKMLIVPKMPIKAYLYIFSPVC